MRIVGIRERPVRISRYRDPRIPSGGLTTSLVAVVTDVVRAGRPVAGYGFASVGRYASGGYPYPEGDIAALSEEIRYFAGLGFTQAKIKIGGASLDHDLRRVEAAAAHLAGSGHLAAGAMNAYDPAMSLTAATALARFGLWWFEDICDPLDFATHARVAARYDPPIAAGEALFSAAEAALPDRHAGLRHDRDILLFDPVHCYGLPGYRQIIDTLTAAGRPRRAFWPHGGHLFSLHLAAVLGLGGAEINPLAFHPFHGPPPALPVNAGRIRLPDVPGIGFELHNDAWQAFRSLSTPPG